LAKDVRKSKPMEAFFGVISVCLSLGATFGWAARISLPSFASFFSFNFLPRITFFAGLHFNPVCLFSPTLCDIIFFLHIN
jgi:hypothetical protein